MEKIQLVEKQANPRDAIVSQLKLTETGERLHSEALVGFVHPAEGVMNNVSAGQLDEMLKLSGK